MLVRLFRQLLGSRGSTRVQPFTGDRAWLKERLASIAATAWSRTGYPDPLMLQLDPANLPSGTSLATARELLRIYYAHVRRWAPGLEIPYSIPPVKYSKHITAAGQFQVDGDGYVQVVLPPSTGRTDALLRAVLAHEACHHILGCSGLNTYNPAVDEPVTDLAMFVCGLGRIFMSGNLLSFRGDDGWSRLHLGYLRPAEYEYLSNWAKNLNRSTASGHTVNTTDNVRRKLLTRLGGSESVMSRYVEFERRSAPGASESELMANALARLENDRR